MYTEQETGQVRLKNVLHMYRLQSRLTQKQLADLSQLSIRAIRDLERGSAKKPRHETIQLLANALRLGTDQRLVLEAAAHGDPSDHELRSVVDGDLIPPPTPMNALVGRTSELMRLTSLLTVDNRRLVSIVGVSGIGKTRLALEVARYLHTHCHSSVLWLTRQGDTGQQDTLEAAALLRARVHEVLTAADNQVDRLGQLLRGRNMLLVVDDQHDDWLPMERLVRLLQTSPRLCVVTTSWAASPGLPEPPFALGPLPVPGEHTEQDRSQVPSMRLLLSRLAQVRPDLDITDSDATALATVCRMLDGLPAALDLAARWAVVLNPPQLAEQLARNIMTLLATPGADDGVFQRILVSLREAHDALTPTQAGLLAAMADINQPWSVLDAAALVHRAMTDVAHDVYAMLIGGLLRRVEHAGQSGYEVLNLVTETLTPAQRMDEPA
jgi:predicted ATPase/transcriptional regulator with XRE-family HTH domain